MDTLEIVASICLHVLSIAAAVLALVKSRRKRVQQTVRHDLEEIEAKAASWKSSALSALKEVESAIERLETKRRSLAAVESRLTARERQGEEIPEEVPTDRIGPNGEMDRATERRLRREAGEM